MIVYRSLKQPADNTERLVKWFEKHRGYHFDSQFKKLKCILVEFHKYVPRMASLKY